MTGPRFQYRHCVVHTGDVADWLNQGGEAGWRLHTCEPVIVTNSEGEPQLHMALVMDKLVAENAPSEAAPDEEPAMRMRG